MPSSPRPLRYRALRKSQVTEGHHSPSSPVGFNNSSPSDGRSLSSSGWRDAQQQLSSPVLSLPPSDYAALSALHELVANVPALRLKLVDSSTASSSSSPRRSFPDALSLSPTLGNNPSFSYSRRAGAPSPFKESLSPPLKTLDAALASAAARVLAKSASLLAEGQGGVSLDTDLMLASTFRRQSVTFEDVAKEFQDEKQHPTSSHPSSLSDSPVPFFAPSSSPTLEVVPSFDILSAASPPPSQQPSPPPVYPPLSTWPRRYLSLLADDLLKSDLRESADTRRRQTLLRAARRVSIVQSLVGGVSSAADDAGKAAAVAAAVAAAEKPKKGDGGEGALNRERRKVKEMQDRAKFRKGHEAFKQAIKDGATPPTPARRMSVGTDEGGAAAAAASGTSGVATNAAPSAAAVVAPSSLRRVEDDAGNSKLVRLDLGALERNIKDRPTVPFTCRGVTSDYLENRNFLYMHTIRDAAGGDIACPGCGLPMHRHSMSEILHIENSIVEEYVRISIRDAKGVFKNTENALEARQRLLQGSLALDPAVAQVLSSMAAGSAASSKAERRLKSRLDAVDKERFLAEEQAKRAKREEQLRVAALAALAASGGRSPPRHPPPLVKQWTERRGYPPPLVKASTSRTIAVDSDDTASTPRQPPTPAAATTTTMSQPLHSPHPPKQKYVKQPTPHASHSRGRKFFSEDSENDILASPTTPGIKSPTKSAHTTPRHQDPSSPVPAVAKANSPSKESSGNKAQDKRQERSPASAASAPLSSPLQKRALRATSPTAVFDPKSSSASPPADHVDASPMQMRQRASSAESGGHRQRASSTESSGSQRFMVIKELDPEKKKLHDKIKKEKEKYFLDNPKLKEAHDLAQKSREDMKQIRVDVRNRQKKRMLSILLVQCAWRVFVAKSKVKVLRRKKLRVFAVGAVEKIMSRALGNVVHRVRSDVNKKLVAVKMKQRAASQIQKIWTSAQTRRLKRGRWTEMYQGRKMEKTKKTEMRKEMWTAKVMSRAKNEATTMRLLDEGRRTDKYMSDLEIGVEKALNDTEKADIDEVISSELKERKIHDVKIKAIEDKMHCKVGETEFAKQLREKRRAKKRRIFQNLNDASFSKLDVNGKTLQFADATFIELEVRGNAFENKDERGLSDPYLVVCRVLNDDEATLSRSLSPRSYHSRLFPVHRSEIQMNTLKPHWTPMIISIEAICRHDLDCPIVIQAIDWDTTTPHDFIGEIRTSMREILFHAGSEEYLNIKDHVGTITGCVKFQSCTFRSNRKLSFDFEGVGGEDWNEQKDAVFGPQSPYLKLKGKLESANKKQGILDAEDDA